MFDEMGKSLASGDLVKAQRTFADMQERYASSTYTHQAGLALAKRSPLAGNRTSKQSVPNTRNSSASAKSG
jgi:outer membrane protein assembly factor BamD (BamD/ComL family)